MLISFDPDWTELRLRYYSCAQNGCPVLEWDVFRFAVQDMVNAHRDLVNVHRWALDAQEHAVPNNHDNRYPGFLEHVPFHVKELFALTDDELPVPPSIWDCQFHLTLGDQSRNPLGYMKRRTQEFRTVSRRLRRGLRAYEAATRSLTSSPQRNGKPR